MSYLLDTDTLSELVRRRPSERLRRRLVEVSSDDLFTSVVNVAELRYGAALRDDRDIFWRKISGEILSRVTILAVDGRAATVAGDIRALLRRRGETIGLADVLIGAVAIANDLAVVTNNVSHFERVPDLRCETWI
jgi:predicted nucleic acid-binding protein